MIVAVARATRFARNVLLPVKHESLKGLFRYLENTFDFDEKWPYGTSDLEIS